jgi:hypothetical protein
MNYRPRPGGGSLPPAENRAFRALGPVDGQESARFTADVILVGSGWHQPAGSAGPQPPGVGPGPGTGSGVPGSPRDLAGPPALVGASEPARLQLARSDLAAAFAAGFTHQAERDRARRDNDGTSGNLAGGFAPGGGLDQMLPGAELAAHLAAARRAGFGRLGDTETCGVIAACRRLASWAAEGELTAIASLDTRRAAPSGRPGEHVDAEIAPLLTLTPQGAAALTGLARDLARLPQTRALLAAGVIDRDRAEIIAQGLSVLSDEDAAVVEDRVARKAGEQTTGRLRARVAGAVKAHDPEAAERRKEKAQDDARVEVWAEAAGTAALAGRDLPPAGVMEGDKSLDADARWLKARGVPGSHDKRRADAFLARLTGRPLTSLIPPATAASPTAPGPTTGAGPAPRGTSTGTGTETGINGTTPGPDQAGPRLGGTVHLTMPAATWLGLTDNPGDIPGLGPTDASTCRDLAGTLAANPASKWCITLTDAKGRAVAHGCARAGPGPPATTGTTRADRRSWLAKVTITPIATGTCDHRRESAGYQPSDKLRHLVKTRSPRCGFPGCRRPATRCDDDHTVAHHKGGRTCECNLHPLCRYHHQVKQAPGWHLDQPEPGVLVWTTPSGRIYTTTAEPYPA